jgi:GT2 family glycosyltransferase
MKYTISVVIPTLDREEITLATLKSFENQSFRDFELIVLDQASPASARLAAFKTEAYRYRYHHHDEKSLPNARNVAARIAEGAILLFVDDDVVAQRDLVWQYFHEFNKQDKSVWVIGGQIHESNSNIFREKEGIAGGYVTYYGKTLKNFCAADHSECQWVGGGNFAVLKEKFLQVGGFDANFIGNAILEDGDFGFRVRSSGGRVLYSPYPVVEHLRAKSGGTRRFNNDFSMYFRSHNTVYFFRKHKRKVYLPIVFLYLSAVWLNDLIQKKHSIKAYYYTLKGFMKGFATKLPK